MRSRFLQTVAWMLVYTLAAHTLLWAQPGRDDTAYFEKVKLLVQQGNKENKINVVLLFEPNRLIISHPANGEMKAFPYARMTRAAYLQAKHSPKLADFMTPAAFWQGDNWGAGSGKPQPILAHRDPNKYMTEGPQLLGRVGAVVFLVVGALGLIALQFSNGKKHWLAVYSQDDYAMLQLDKKNYKPILSRLETRTGLKVEALDKNE